MYIKTGDICVTSVIKMNEKKGIAVLPLTEKKTMDLLLLFVVRFGGSCLICGIRCSTFAVYICTLVMYTTWCMYIFFTRRYACSAYNKTTRWPLYTIKYKVTKKKKKKRKKALCKVHTEWSINEWLGITGTSRWRRVNRDCGTSNEGRGWKTIDIGGDGGAEEKNASVTVIIDPVRRHSITPMLGSTWSAFRYYYYYY
jgi:hypothetical protein